VASYVGVRSVTFRWGRQGGLRSVRVWCVGVWQGSAGEVSFVLFRCVGVRQIKAWQVWYGG